MYEELEQKEPKTSSISFKVTKNEKDTVINFVKDRGWKMSSFIRVVILKEIKRLNNED